MNLLKERLIELRESKGIGRSRLAQLSRVSRRQIIRIESEPNGKRRKHTIKNLAKALNVEPGVLTGELPMPEPNDMNSVELAPRESTESVSARITADIRLAYDLVSVCYGITQSDLIRMAPLLFTVLAEGSLAWRRRKLDQIREFAEKMHDVATHPKGSSIGHLAFAHSVYSAEAGAECERESINRGDVLGLELRDDAGGNAYDYGFDPQEGNAFVDYLRMLAIEAASPDFVDPEDIAPGDDDLPSYKVCREVLNRVTGGSDEFHRALKDMEMRIPGIPYFLMYDFRSPKGRAGYGELETARQEWFAGLQRGQHHPTIQEMLDREASSYEEFSISLTDSEGSDVSVQDQ